MLKHKSSYFLCVYYFLDGKNPTNTRFAVLFCTVFVNEKRPNYPFAFHNFFESHYNQSFLILSAATNRLFYETL